jgi:diguanylate cyclase (GGDEF)-like protein
MSTSRRDVHVIDTSAWDKLRGSSSPGRAGELAYVIVADTLESRIAVCLAALKPYNLGVLVARNGDEALGLLRRFAAPVLLIVDLSLPAPDGFTLIEAVRQGSGRTEIIAWSSLRGLREFAAHRLRGDHVRVLGGGVAPNVVQRVIERALGGRGSGDSTARPPDPVEEMMGALATKARSLCRTAGGAVYMKPPGASEFRTVMQWDSEEAIPHSPADLPRMFDWILKTGEALVLPDLSRQRASGVSTLRLRDNLRGLVAVPVVSPEKQTIGMLCVFDVRPFKFDGADIDALKALGRGVLTRPAAASPESQSPASRDSGAIAAQIEAPSAPSPSTSAGLSAPISLLDRRDGNLAIARELARVRREQRHLSVILFGVDSMAVSAETIREAQGDLVATVAETLTGAVRGSDLAIRWSREELLVVLAGLNAAEARRVAERVRAAMQAGARVPVAVAGGVAELEPEDTFESVMARANQQAQLAKARGHNRVS